MNIITTVLKNFKKRSDFYLYQDVVNTWQQRNFKRQIPEEKELLLEEFFFCNPLINNNGEPVYFVNWIPKGILKIKHIWDKGMEAFMSFEGLGNTYNLIVNCKHENEYRIKAPEALPSQVVTNLVGEKIK